MARAIPKILKRPLVTEKSTALGESNRYVFEVANNASKPEVRQAVQQAFNVSVIDVNTVTMRTKGKRFGVGFNRPTRMKKAVVRLKEGDKIQLFENI